MDELIKGFQDTGPCEVYIDKVVEAWTDKFSISQYKDEYRLVEYYEGPNCAKVTISKEQALEIIEKAKLFPIKDSVFRSGTTYRSEKNIISELARFENLKKEKPDQIEFLNDIILQYKKALEQKHPETKHNDNSIYLHI